MTAAQTSMTQQDRHGTAEPRPFRWTSADGLSLSGCEWRPTTGTQTRAIPILCLAGLSRNTRDFNDIARFLQSHGYRVIALDYRGRGKSAWDPNWQNYSIAVEAGDIDAAIDLLQLDRFAVLGTSRGGLHAMAMAHRYDKNRLAGVILNDIGPHIEMSALHRLAGIIGQNMKFTDKAALTEHLKRSMSLQFPRLSDNDWLKWADQIATETGQGCVLDYDPALGNTLADLDDEAPWPDLWPLFQELDGIPLQVIHGARSDLLSTETCQKMRDLHPAMELVTAAEEGHAPLLWDTATQSAIAGFLGRLA